MSEPSRVGKLITCTAGKTTLNGRQVAVNTDFATQVISLAEVLDCSERYVAILSQHVISSSPNLRPTNILEEAVLEHHRRRRELVECLRFLLEATETATTSDAPPIYARLALFVQRQLLPPEEQAGGLPTGDKSLGRKIVLEIERLDSTIAKAQVAKQSTGSQTTIQGSHPTSFSYAFIIHMFYRCQYLVGSRSSCCTAGVSQIRTSQPGNCSLPHCENRIPISIRNRTHRSLATAKPSSSHVILSPHDLACRIRSC